MSESRDRDGLDGLDGSKDTRAASKDANDDSKDTRAASKDANDDSKNTRDASKDANDSLKEGHVEIQELDDKYFIVDLLFVSGYLNRWNALKCRSFIWLTYFWLFSFLITKTQHKYKEAKYERIKG